MKIKKQMENSVSSKSFKERCKEWKSTTDFESVRCVFNILPDEFRKRVENNTFDRSLLTSVKGGDYEVPLYYVTKAWDILLRGSLFPIDFMIGPEEELDCTQEEIKEFLEENNASRSRYGARNDNQKMKALWKEMFDVDIDSLDIDFSKYNMHLPPNVSDDEYHFYFHDVCGGVNEWIMGTINRPESKDITHDAVSALMEFTAEILWWREDELWYEH